LNDQVRDVKIKRRRYICAKKKKGKKKNIFKVCSKTTVADRHNAKLINICVYSVYVL